MVIDKYQRNNLLEKKKITVHSEIAAFGLLNSIV